MRLRSFLNIIWNKIKSLFNGISPEMKTAIKIGVVITENIKNFVDSPVADVLTALITGNIDDEIKNWLKAKLRIILTELKLADGCRSLTDPQEITKCAIKVLQDLGGDTRNAFLHNLAIFIAQTAANGHLIWGDGILLLEWCYKNEYKAIAS